MQPPSTQQPFITMDFIVSEVRWEDNSHELAAIRLQVFVVEQKVPEDLEWDGIDPQCRHVIARDHCGRPIGTGRLLPDGHIGRMAVVAAHRRQGVGRAMLELLLKIAERNGHPVARLHAQTYAIPFYAKFGFIAEGEEFMEADIPHWSMHRLL